MIIPGRVGRKCIFFVASNFVDFWETLFDALQLRSNLLCRAHEMSHTELSDICRGEHTKNVCVCVWKKVRDIR